MRKLALFTLILLSISGAAYAKDSDTKTGQASIVEQVNQAEEVGNKICPVSGEKIDERTKETYEYKGKIYSFCCPDCVEEFKKDPEKYIERLKKSKESEQEHSTQGEHQHHND